MKKPQPSFLNVTSVIVSSTLALSLAACSQTKELKEMHDSTGQMATTTKSMNDSMTAMNGSLQSVSSETTGLCHGSTQALALQARQMTLNQMDRSQTGQDKVYAAVSYFEAFDFQAWPLCGADQDELDHMIDDAMLEFFKVVFRYDSGSSAPNPLLTSGASGKDAQDLSFSALAAGLHMVNRHQLQNHDKNPDAPVYSMYSIIQKTLRDGQKVSKGTMELGDLKQYEHDILVNEPEAIKLLQARQNMAIATVVLYAKNAKQSGLSNLLNLARDRYTAKLSGVVDTWNFDPSQWNASQLSEYSDYLKIALETRSFLREIGIKPVVNPNLTALVSGMTPLMAKSMSGESAAPAKAFMASLEQIKKEI